MRRHAADMYKAISRKAEMTEEQVDDYRNRLITSFNDGQSTWDVYRSHLTEHGIVPESHKNLSANADRARLMHQCQASMEAAGPEGRGRRDAHTNLSSEGVGYDRRAAATGIS
jgi:hypothetical protein